MSKLSLKADPTLADLQQYVRDMVAERGFHDTPEKIPHRFMLLIEEIGEFAKASRKSAGMRLADDADKQHVEHEAADILIIFLGLCNMMNIDLEQAFRDKEEINKTRTWR
jgi:NTP pyrophosphatase (non-canonical NTP hydrolase)